MGSRTRRRSSGIGMVNLTRCSSGGPGQGPVIGVRIAGARHEHLGRTHVSKKVTKLFRELVLMIAQFTVAEREFKAIRWRHSQSFECLVPLSTTNLGDVVRIRSRRRREPTGATVGRHRNSDRDPAICLLGNEQSASDRLIVLMRRQHQCSSWKQGTRGGSPRQNLRPPPHRPDRRPRDPGSATRHWTGGQSERECQQSWLEPEDAGCSIT